MKTISDLEDNRQDVQNRRANEYKNRNIIVSWACGIAAVQAVMDGFDDFNVRDSETMIVCHDSCSVSVGLSRL